MIKTTIKIAWRNLLKNSGISAINIFGLSIGLAVCTLIALYLQYEYSFDKNHPDHERFYRLTTTFKYPNSPESEVALSSPMMGPYLQRESGDIEAYLRVFTDNENFLCRANSREKAIEKNLRVDTSFFEFFNYSILHGNARTAFDRLENILLTRPVSEELFGTQNPVGQSVEYTYAIDASRDTTVQYIVSAVFDHLPENSHLQFESLMPINPRAFNFDDPNSLWHGVLANTYFRLHPSEDDPRKVAAAFPALLQKEMPYADMVGLSLQPFGKIHLGSGGLQSDENNHQKSSGSYLRILGWVALFILLISSINFANLSTVLAMRRIREVGVRKSLGAKGKDVLFQFLGEALLLSVIAGVLALVWVTLLREPFLILLDKSIPLVVDPVNVGIYLFVIVLLGLLAGLFPALQAARYAAVEAFRQKAVSVKRPFIQRLVVLQFMLSGILIISSVVCYKQLWFLQNKDLGFQYDQVIELDLGFANWTRASTLHKQLSALPGVLEVSGSDVSLGTIDGQNGVLIRNETTREWENHPMSINRAAPNYFDLYGVQFVAGRPPTPEGAAHEREYVVNESFVKKAGWKEDPVGKEIRRAGMETVGRVVGVIKDIHHNTLYHAIGPICFQASTFTPVLSLKVSPSNLQHTLTEIENIWATQIKDRAFDFKFMDAHFAALYRTETQLGQLLLMATLLSILIACLGLLALSAFIIQQRTKEIGIRKVLGATTTGIVALLSKDLVKLVLIAFVIASPLAWYVMDRWLQDFAYRIRMEWWMFVMAGTAAVVIAFLTVSLQSTRAALADPVESLKSE